MSPKVDYISGPDHNKMWVCLNWILVSMQFSLLKFLNRVAA